MAVAGLVHRQRRVEAVAVAMGESGPLGPTKDLRSAAMAYSISARRP
jgi:hypothetical protein